MNDGSGATRIRAIEGIDVRYGPVDPDVVEPRFERNGPNGFLVANQRHAVLRIAGVAAFSVRADSVVMVEAEAGAHPAEVDAYLLGTVTALVLAQQARFALHGSIVTADGSSIAIAGPRGAGKSTTSLSLRERGHHVRGDDIAILEPEGHGVRYLTTERPLYIAPETARALGVDTTDAVRTGPRVQKLALRQDRQPPGRLEGIVVLALGPGPEVHVTTPDPLRRLRLIEANTYRRGALRPLWGRELVEWALGVASQVPVGVLTRPSEGWSVHAVAEAIEHWAADLATGECQTAVR